MRTYLLRSGAVAVAIVAITMPGPPPAVADDRPPSVTTDPAVVSLAEEYGIPVTEAAERIRWQHLAAEARPVIEQRLGGSFAGLWVDEAGGGRVKLSVTGDTQTARSVLLATGLAPFAEVVTVEYSNTELLAARDTVLVRLQSLAANAPYVQASVGIRPSLNTVTVSLPAAGFGRVASETVATNLRSDFGGAVAVELTLARIQRSECVDPYCDPPLRAGVRIYNGHGGCTSGFPARSRSDGKLYIMTAGHCGIDHPNAAWWSRRTNGSELRIGRTLEHRRVYERRGDVQIVSVAEPADWNTRAWVFVRDGGDTTRDKQYPITRDTNADEGFRVCMAGAATGTHCGTVLSADSCFLIDSSIFCNLSSASYRSRDGDSGAPVFGYNWAYGINVGFVPGTALSYFMRIREAENFLNVDVAHHGG